MSDSTPALLYAICWLGSLFLVAVCVRLLTWASAFTAGYQVGKAENADDVRRMTATMDEIADDFLAQLRGRL
jgi:hypothetical protein